MNTDAVQRKGKINHQLPESSKYCGSKLGGKSTYQTSELEPEYPVGRQPGGEKGMESRKRSKRAQRSLGLGPSASGEIR